MQQVFSYDSAFDLSSYSWHSISTSFACQKIFLSSFISVSSSRYFSGTLIFPLRPKFLSLSRSEFVFISNTKCWRPIRNVFNPMSSKAQCLCLCYSSWKFYTKIGFSFHCKREWHQTYMTPVQMRRRAMDKRLYANAMDIFVGCSLRAFEAVAVHRPTTISVSFSFSLVAIDFSAIVFHGSSWSSTINSYVRVHLWY